MMALNVAGPDCDGSRTALYRERLGRSPGGLPALLRGRRAARSPAAVPLRRSRPGVDGAPADCTRSRPA
ncbi:hypothetical protein NKH18_45030 [Streptomyces sp. M10(2022)]